MARKPVKVLLHRLSRLWTDMPAASPVAETCSNLLLDHRLPQHQPQPLAWDAAMLDQMLPRNGSADLFGHDPRDGRILFNPRLALGLHRTDGGWTTPNSGEEFQRAARILNDMAGLDMPFLADMHDHRMQGGVALADGRIVPVFQYNRRPDAPGTILWPLSGHYQRLGSSTYFGGAFRDQVPFAAKRDVVFWRGAPTGYDSAGRRAAPSLRDHAAGKLGHADCAARLRDVPRFALLRAFQHLPDYDLAFARAQGQPSAAEFGYRETARLDRATMCAARYQLVVQGNDVGSAFPWLAQTQCLILRQDAPWDVCYSAAFQPWQHYVPIAADFSDLPDKLSWARAHPQACQDMIACANQVADILAQPRFEEHLRSSVLTRYRAAITA